MRVIAPRGRRWADVMITRVMAPAAVMLARHQRAGWVARSEIRYGLFSAGLPTMGFAALNPSYGLRHGMIDGCDSNSFVAMLHGGHLPIFIPPIS